MFLPLRLCICFLLQSISWRQWSHSFFRQQPLSLSVNHCKRVNISRRILLVVGLFRKESKANTAVGDDVCLWVHVRLFVSVHILVCIQIYVCLFLHMLCFSSFPAPGMFKAGSCAVRMCLSLFSKRTRSAFCQRAVLDRPGIVQSWARINKHRQNLILSNEHWLGRCCNGSVGLSRWDNVSLQRLVLFHNYRLFCWWSDEIGINLVYMRTVLFATYDQPGLIWRCLGPVVPFCGFIFVCVCSGSHTCIFSYASDKCFTVKSRLRQEIKKRMGT